MGEKALFSKAGLAEAVAELAKKEVEKHSKRYAASEVGGMAGKMAGRAIDKLKGPAAEAAVKKRAAQAKKNINNLYSTQKKAYGRQEKLAKKKGIALIPPESKKEEEAKLLEVLKKAAVQEAHKLIKEQHHIIDTEAQNAAKEEAALGLKHLKGLLIAKLRKEVDDASKATAVKLAQAATSKEVQSEQA